MWPYLYVHKNDRSKSRLTLQTAAAAPRVQYVAHQSGQQVIMMTPQQMHQPG